MTYNKFWFNRRYAERRAEALKILGGKCVNCGSTENLELDHIDPTTKTLKTSEFYLRTKAIFDREIVKCQLLCKECHTVKSRTESIKVVCKNGHPREGYNLMKNSSCRICYNISTRDSKRRSRARAKSQSGVIGKHDRLKIDSSVGSSPTFGTNLSKDLIKWMK